MVADSHVVALKVFVHQAVVVLDPMLQQQFIGDVAELPPRSHISGGPIAGEAGDEVDAFHQDCLFLFGGQIDGVFVGVPVHPYLVSGLDYHRRFLGECFDGVAGDEPRGLYPQFVEQFKQSRGAYFAGEYAPGDIVGRVLPAIRPQPTGNGVQVHPEGAQYLLSSHNSLPHDPI